MKVVVFGVGGWGAGRLGGILFLPNSMRFSSSDSISSSSSVSAHSSASISRVNDRRCLGSLRHERRRLIRIPLSFSDW